MNRRHMIPVLMSLILPGVTGCCEADTKDPTIDVRQQETFLLALAKARLLPNLYRCAWLHRKKRLIFGRSQ